MRGCIDERGYTCFGALGYVGYDKGGGGRSVTCSRLARWFITMRVCGCSLPSVVPRPVITRSYMILA